MSKEFKITSTKSVTNYLGVAIDKLNDGSIFINQSRFIQHILKKFNMSEANCVSTPIETNWHINNFEKDPSKAPYREAVGNLMYIQVVSRPDMSYAVNIGFRALVEPSVTH